DRRIVVPRWRPRLWTYSGLGELMDPVGVTDSDAFFSQTYVWCCAGSAHLPPFFEAAERDCGVS
ncbi:MAG: hypothetical protein EB075_14440, partial [Bacteroidetes bacterium]|nr:hypothetical protein [Bacteroidota bacterium]